MKKGEIYIACDKEKHPHPIVFLEQLSNGKFKACILSTKNTNGNILMLNEHFLEKDEKGIMYRITFNKSHLVPKRVFIKEDLWLSSKIPQGKLSDAGIEFIERFTNGVSPEFHPIPIWASRKK